MSIWFHLWYSKIMSYSQKFLWILKNASRKYPDCLADSCKRSSVNRMAAGSRLQVQVMDFFFFHLFSNMLCAIKLRVLGLMAYWYTGSAFHQIPQSYLKCVGHSDFRSSFKSGWIPVHIYKSLGCNRGIHRLNTLYHRPQIVAVCYTSWLVQLEKLIVVL